MNTCTLIGRLTKDPEVRYTQSNKAVASFTLAVNKKVKGEQAADFIPIIVWDKLAEIAAKYLGKGMQVGIIGRIVPRSYDSEGGKKYITEIIAEELDFIDTKRDPEGKQDENKPAETKTAEADVKMPWDVD